MSLLHISDMFTPKGRAIALECQPLGRLDFFTTFTSATQAATSIPWSNVLAVKDFDIKYSTALYYIQQEFKISPEFKISQDQSDLYRK